MKVDDSRDAVQLILAALRGIREDLRKKLGDRWPQMMASLGTLVERLPDLPTVEDFERLERDVRRIAEQYGWLHVADNAVGSSSSIGPDHSPFTARQVGKHGVNNQVLQAHSGLRGAQLRAWVGETVEWLGREEPPRVSPHPAGPAPDFVTTHPRVQVPDSVVHDQPFDVVVSLDANPSTEGGVTIGLAGDGQNPIEVDVEVILPEDGSIDAVADTPLHGRLVVGETGQSPSLGFRLIGRRSGSSTIYVAFRRVRVELLRIAVEVYVASEATSTPHAQQSPRSFSSRMEVSTPEPAEVVVLRVDRRGTEEDRSFWRCDLSGTAEFLDFSLVRMQEISSSMQMLLVDLCHEFHGEFSATQSEKVRQGTLRRIGTGLANRLLPADIQRELQKLPEGTSLHIESNDAWAPWEMLWLGTPTEGFFLGERFAVTRGLREGSRRDRLRNGRAVLVAPRDSGLSPMTERSALKRLTGSKPFRIGSLEQVYDLLDGSLSDSPKGWTFLHFVAHGVYSAKDPQGGHIVLEEDQPLKVMRIEQPAATPDGVDASTPLAGACVFINSCQTGIGGRPTLSGHGGFAEAFSRAGTAGFIAPSWAVLDRAAAKFAKTLYEGLGAGKTLGEAARLARVATREHGRDRLAYAVYALPGLRMSSVRPDS